MPQAGWALQKGVFDKLAADAVVTERLGGARIYDDVPRKAEFPYVTFGQSTLYDWSTGTEDGAEHVLTLHVWSNGGGKRETFEIMDAVTASLSGQSLALSGHHLVSLRLEFAEARRDPDRLTYHGILRFRAVTEPIS
ncbi:MAG: DUF3168 domain-containing protein [Hyphomicrobiales bacterium]